MEKQKLVTLGRIVIEIVILVIYYIVVLGWVSNDNDQNDMA